MIDRRRLFQNAWHNARRTAGTRYGVTISLRKAFAIELKKAWKAAKDQAALMERMSKGFAAATAQIIAEGRAVKAAGLPTPGAERKPWQPGTSWHFANTNPYGGL